MVDLGTGIAVVGSSPLIMKLLGPTAEYLGEGLKLWSEVGINNLNRIFKKAIQKTGDKIEQDGTVPPKVLKGVLVDGPFCEDELSAEYFGGVMASSRSGISRDDRGNYLLSLLSSLSTYQIRTHYILYSALRSLFKGARYNIEYDKYDSLKKEVFLPYDSYWTAMEFTEDEYQKINPIVHHIFTGLAKEKLIGEFHYGPVADIQKLFAGATSGGIIYTYSSIGIELFLWTHGYGDCPKFEIFNDQLTFEIDQGIEIPLGYVPTKRWDK